MRLVAGISPIRLLAFEMGIRLVEDSSCGHAGSDPLHALVSVGYKGSYLLLHIILMNITTY